MNIYALKQNSFGTLVQLIKCYSLDTVQYTVQIMYNKNNTVHCTVIYNRFNTEYSKTERPLQSFILQHSFYDWKGKKYLNEFEQKDEYTNESTFPNRMKV